MCVPHDGVGVGSSVHARPRRMRQHDAHVSPLERVSPLALVIRPHALLPIPAVRVSTADLR